MRKTTSGRIKYIWLLITVIFLMGMLNTGYAFASDREDGRESDLKEKEGGTQTVLDQVPYLEPKNLSEAQQKMSTNLLQITDVLSLPQGLSKNTLVNQMIEQKQLRDKPVSNGIESGSALEAYVYISLNEGASIDSIKPFVAKLVSKDISYGLVAAWVEATSLDDLAELKAVKSIREVMQPIVNEGSALTEGDAILNTDDVRSQLGYDGTGVKIGIISDGVDHLSSAVSTGDLPGDVTVLSNSIGGDEGTAMLEIVYDLAPGADLYFHDAGSNVIEFNSAISDLASAGCTVICDDIGWIQEPFFEDGIIAQHVESITDGNDIVYVSSAGNAAYKHYQGLYCSDGGTVHDFSSGTEPVYKHLYVDIRPGEVVRIVLQWDDSFGSSGNDYDLLLTEFNDTSKVLCYSANEQSGSEDPIEWIYARNNLSYTVETQIVVDAYDTSKINELEVYIYGGQLYSNNLVAEDSIFGHPAVDAAIACAAVGASTPNTIESYSSVGPVTMIGETRQKPDISGVAGVSVTGAGGFPNPFYGTSASAPHVAAVAAILQQRFPTFNASTIKQIITDNGVDLGSTGFDYDFGFGRADALASAESYVYANFNSQGGSDVDSQLIAKGGKATVPSETTKSECAFGGWYKESGCLNEWDFDTDTVAVDTELFAKWYENYGLIFDEGTGAITDQIGTIGTIIIPSMINDVSVVSIGDNAFDNSSALLSVTIPDSITSIGAEAFYGCSSLTSVYISDSVTSIGTDAFASCSASLIVYGPLGCYAETYCDANGITYYGYTDAYGSGVMGRTYERPDGSVYSITYFNGSTCTDPKIQADYYDEAGVMFFTEQFGADGSIVASIWFHPGTIVPSVKNYYDHGTLYFQEEYDAGGTMIASISYHPDGVSRYFKNYYNNGVMYFQEEYDTQGIMIASIWFQADGVTRHFKNYYNGYLYFQEEYNTSGTMIASINFREDGVTRERKCYYRESDGALYLIEYYDTNGDLIDSYWF